MNPEFFTALARIIRLHRRLPGVIGITFSLLSFFLIFSSLLSFPLLSFPSLSSQALSHLANRANRSKSKGTKIIKRE
jgi:hypothetical protein